MSLTQTQVTYTEAVANLDRLCEQVISDSDAIIITRKDGENVALIAADRANASKLYVNRIWYIGEELLMTYKTFN
jgi:hypothetical protein